MPIRITLAHDSQQEARAAAALMDVLAQFDLGRWMFTDHVTIDETAIGSSHPLTLGPNYLLLGPDSALALFLHEQLHWLAASSSNAAEAIAEAGDRWPDPPDFPDGATDKESTWLHFVVCSFEYQSLLELIGEERAKAILETRYGYRWIYKTIIDEWKWFQDLFERHKLGIPQASPKPERFSGAGAEIHLGEGLPTLELATGNPRESRVAEIIKSLFEKYDLARWAFADRVRVQALVPPSIDPPTVNTFFLGKPIGILSQWLWVQFAVFVSSALDETQSSGLADLVGEDFWLTAKGPRDDVALAACVNEILALRSLLRESEFVEAVENTTAARFYPALPERVSQLASLIHSKGLLAPLLM